MPATRTARDCLSNEHIAVINDKSLQAIKRCISVEARRARCVRQGGGSCAGKCYSLPHRR
jgi:hypothetical protein